jgi:hypothetical protein
MIQLSASGGQGCDALSDRSSVRREEFSRSPRPSASAAARLAPMRL